MNGAETERLVEENRQLREEIERWKVVCQLYNAGMMEDAARISDLRMTVHREAARTIDDPLPTPPYSPAKGQNLLAWAFAVFVLSFLI